MAKKAQSKKTAAKAKTTPANEPAPTVSADTPPAWSRLHLWQIQWVRDVLVGLLVLGLFWLGQKISIVTVPLLLALLFAYLFEPVIEWLMRKTRLQRKGAVGAIIACTLIFVVAPASVGVTYGTIQGVGLLASIARKTEVVWASVRADRIADEASRRLTQMQAAAGADPNADSTDDGAADDVSGGDDSAGDDEAVDGEPVDDDAVAAHEQAVDDEGAGLDLDEAPTQAEIDAQQAERDKLREDARVKLLKVPEEWRPVHDWLIEQRDDGTIDEAFGTLQTWIRANADNVAGTAASAGVNVAQRTIRFAAGTFGLLFMLFLTLFFFFFVSTGWVQVKGFGVKLLPERNKGRVIHLLVEFNRVINAFIRGRLTIAFIQTLVFTLGYLIIGVPAAFILGPIVALLSIVPYLALLGVPVSIGLLWLEGHTGIRGHWLWIIGAPTVLYFMVQSLDDYVLTPWIQGKSTDMSTPMILFASLAGGVLFGVFGLLIAIPIAACLKILIQEIFWPRFKAWTEGEADDFLPIQRE